MSKDKKGQILWKLFWSMLYISAFTFGGGFVIVTFMKRKFVDELHWMEESEMLDLTALAQCSPGAIAVNVAILVGCRVAGAAGITVAVLGTILPPLLILSVLSLFYRAFASNIYVMFALKGMQAAVAAVILDVVCSLGTNIWKEKGWLQKIVMITAFLAAFFLDVGAITIILAAAAVGICAEIRRHRGQRRQEK